MSQRLRSPVIVARRSKPPHPSPSPRPRTKNKSKPFEILKRCSSAPLLSRRNEDDVDVDVDVDGHSFRSGGGTLFRPQTFSDAFVSSPSLFATSPKIYANEVIRLNSLLIKHMLVLLGLVYCSWQNPRRRAQLIWLILNFTITVPAINLRSISSSFLIYRVEIFVFCFGLVLAIFNKSFYYAFYKLHQMAFFFPCLLPDWFLSFEAMEIKDCVNQQTKFGITELTLFHDEFPKLEGFSKVLTNVVIVWWGEN